MGGILQKGRRSTSFFARSVLGTKKMVKVLRGLEDSAPLLKRFSLCRQHLNVPKMFKLPCCRVLFGRLPAQGLGDISPSVPYAQIVRLSTKTTDLDQVLLLDLLSCSSSSFVTTALYESFLFLTSTNSNLSQRK